MHVSGKHGDSPAHGSWQQPQRGIQEAAEPRARGGETRSVGRQK